MNDMILILNYSDEFAVEAAKRLRGERVFCKIISGTTTAAQVAEIAPRGLVLCGEPKSAAGVFDAEILKLDIPVLALGHAAHMLIAAMGGACAGAAISEKKANVQYADCKLFNGVEGGERYIQEAVTLMLPANVQVTAGAGGCTVAFEDSKRSLFGVQFELERNDPDGSTILKNFARDICGCTPWFTMDAALAEARRALTEASIEGGFAVCGVSGGVDSMVAAVLAHQAFGERMTAIYVETGLMRAGDGAAIRAIYEQLGIPLRVIDRAEDVLATLRGRQTMGEKRAMVVSCLHEEMIRQTEAIPGAKTLVMGTNYSDFLGGTNNAAWKDCGMAVLEPLALLFRDEVKEIAGMLGLDDELLLRKPFPLMGLAARILGEVTPQRLSALRTADAIFSEEIREAGLHRKLYKYFPVLVDADELKGSCTIILRAVTVSGAMLVPARLPYDLVERTVGRILETTPAVQRVFYDQTPTPVGKEKFQ